MKSTVLMLLLGALASAQETQDGSSIETTGSDEVAPTTDEPSNPGTPESAT